MKIAVPTNDQINVANRVMDARYFKLFKVEKGVIVKEEIHKKLPEDYDIMISIDDKTSYNWLKEQDLQIITTQEEIITNAIINYIKEYIRIESNNCCCP